MKMEPGWRQGGEGAAPSKEAIMINPIDPGWVRIDDARHREDRRQRRRRRQKDEEEEETQVLKPTPDEKAKLDLVA